MGEYPYIFGADYDIGPANNTADALNKITTRNWDVGGNPAEGMRFFDLSDNKKKFWNGTIWQICDEGGGGGSTAEINIPVSNTRINGTTRYDPLGLSVSEWGRAYSNIDASMFNFRVPDDAGILSSVKVAIMSDANETNARLDAQCGWGPDGAIVNANYVDVLIQNLTFSANTITILELISIFGGSPPQANDNVSLRVWSYTSTGNWGALACACRYQ